MSQQAAADFLTSLAQAVSTMALYKDGHPARERAIDAAYERLCRLQDSDPTPRMTFLGEEIILGDRPLKALKRWDWGRRLASVGVQRLEFTGPVARDDLDAFLDDVYRRLSGQVPDTSETRQSRPTAIRFGTVGLEGQAEGEDLGGAGIATATLAYTLREEVDAVRWLHEELRDREDLHLLEAEAIVRSLSVAMHGDQAFLIPLLRLKRFDQYTTTHAMNVSILAMALAEFVGLGPNEVRMFGISGLLHDLGKVRIPEEILNKPGKLTDEERSVMNGHTVEGARIIIETEENLDLAAVVAYEHHIRLNGGGYPTLHYARACHQASNMVHVCDVFDALRTNRPYRDAWPQQKVLSYIEEGAGTEFDPDLAHAFVQMMRQWEGRIAYVEEAEPLPLGTPVEGRGGAATDGEAPGAGEAGASEGGAAGTAGGDDGEAPGAAPGSGEA